MIFMFFTRFLRRFIRRFFDSSCYENQAFKGRIINRLVIDGSVDDANVNSSYA